MGSGGATPTRQKPARHWCWGDNTAQSTSATHGTSQCPAGGVVPHATSFEGATHAASGKAPQALRSSQGRVHTPQIQLSVVPQALALASHVDRKCVSPPVGSVCSFPQLTIQHTTAKSSAPKARLVPRK